MAHQPVIYRKDEQNGYAYQKDAKGWKHRNFEMDNMVVTNSYGFHDIERAQQHANQPLRIAAVGDSFTASIHVPVKDTWTQVLENQLSDTLNKTTEVINLGLDGTGTDIHVNILSSHLDNHYVDMAILAFYANDILDMTFHKVFRENYGDYVISYQNSVQKERVIEYIEKYRPSKTLRSLYDMSYLIRAVMYLTHTGRLLRGNVVAPKDAGIRELRQYSEKEHGDRIRSVFSQLVKVSQRAGTAVVIVPVPAKESQTKSMDILLAYINKEQKQVLRVIDVVPAMLKLMKEKEIHYHQLFWKYDGHLNKTGNEIYGLALAGELSRRIGEMQ